ncbi:MAG: hypothetical protein HY271_04895 [Deltaproteobacteria bacterium]|nr:hypothetical protein [Deltaproteobacteria bacterium]
MKRTLCAAGIAALCLIWAAPAAANGIADHLKCYQVQDALKLGGTVDLNSPQFGVEAGCKVSTAMFFCVPVTKTNVAVTNKTTKQPIRPQPVSGPDPGDRVCYKVKCPKPTTKIPNQSVTDQFGNRTITKFKATLLCTPAVKGTAFCGNGSVDPGEQCDSTNLNGGTCETEGFAKGTLACGPGCRYDTSGCVGSTVPGCGNGVREGDESCDGADFGGATCASLGFAGGTLGCTAGCGFDGRECVGPGCASADMSCMTVCSSDADCPDTRRCYLGRCEPKLTDHRACLKHNDCLSDCCCGVYPFTSCGPTKGICRQLADCGTTASAVGGECPGAPCGQDSDCYVLTQFCTGGVCEQKQENGVQCQFKSGCLSDCCCSTSGGRCSEAAACTGTCTGPCTPTTCAAEGKSCGTIPDGCGGTLDCGSCTAPRTCGGGGTPNVCGCPSNCGGDICGTVVNSCGQQVSCGTCPSNKPKCCSDSCVCATCLCP